MKKFLIGQSPLTSLSGYLLSVLFVVRDLNMAGIHNWQDYLLPAAIALFGRLSGDDNSRPRPPFPSMPPMERDGAPFTKPDSFLRRGRSHSQPRTRSGRFAPAV